MPKLRTDPFSLYDMCTPMNTWISLDMEGPRTAHGNDGPTASSSRAKLLKRAHMIMSYMHRQLARGWEEILDRWWVICVLEGQGHYASQGRHLPMQGCKSWRAPLAKPHGDHHRTTHANVASAIIDPMQVPTRAKLWSALVITSYFSECSEFHSFMSRLHAWFVQK